MVVAHCKEAHRKVLRKKALRKERRKAPVYSGTADRVVRRPH